MEICLVILTGRVRIHAGDQDFGLLGERQSVFDGLPWSVYVPAHSHWTVEAETAAEVAVCASPAEGRLPARIIPPSEVGEEVRGKGTNTRYVRNILPDNRHGREPAGGGSGDARRQLVELSAA